MHLIFSYLDNHKEWIFSGIGVTVILTIIQIIPSIISRFRVKRTYTSKPFNRFPNYSYNPFQSDEKYVKVKQKYIINCSIKTHSLLLNKIKNGLSLYQSLIWIDIDKFTQINNIFGKECGDIIINVILNILYVIYREYECKIFHAIRRDEFYIITSESNLEKCARRFLFLIHQYRWSDIVPNLFVTCSIGIASNKSNAIDTMQKARVSLNLVKAQGGNMIGPQILKLNPHEPIDLDAS